MVTVELSIPAKNGKIMIKEIQCLRPHPGDDILVDGEDFFVCSVALQAGESKVLAAVNLESGKRLSVKTLEAMGFVPVEDDK
jgi:DNA-directed RNA polymerase specialized sigma54-like protein